LDFFILLGQTGPTHLGLGQIGPTMNSGDTLHCSLCRTVESNPYEGEGEGEGEEQRDGDGLRDGGNTEGRSLSTVHMQRKQWRAAQTKEKEKGKGKSSAAVMDWGMVEMQ